MNRSFYLPVLFLASCSLISPYNITFTTKAETVVDPSKDTLDLVVSAETLAYISKVTCDEDKPITLLPVVAEGMTPSMAHNLSLDVLKDQAPGSLCEINVTAFDQTTTATSSADLKLYVLNKPGDTEAESTEPTVTEEDEDEPKTDETKDEEKDTSVEVKPEADVKTDSETTQTDVQGSSSAESSGGETQPVQ